MAFDGWEVTVINALQPQAPKIIEIFHMGLGWELWTQAELGIQRRREAAQNNNPGAGISIHTSCMREQMVYSGTQKRCDFLTSYQLLSAGGPARLLHEFLELKCLIHGELSRFRSAVKADIDKVKQAVVQPGWANAEYVAGTVMGITVHAIGDTGVESTMRQLAQEEGIEWLWRNEGIHVADLAGYRIMAWIWIRDLVSR